jgi:hypothetical protein
MNEPNQPAEPDDLLAEARATAELFRVGEPPECFTMSRASSITLARAFLLLEVERGALLRALEWASREPTVFGPLHRAAFRSISGEAIAEWLVRHAKETT